MRYVAPGRAAMRASALENSFAGGRRLYCRALGESEVLGACCIRRLCSDAFIVAKRNLDGPAHIGIGHNKTRDDYGRARWISFDSEVFDDYGMGTRFRTNDVFG